MSDSAADTAETLESTHHASHNADSFTVRASLSIAVMAVVAATIGGFESGASNEAVLAKNEAVLSQNKASDTWAFYQANSIKKNMYFVAADSTPAGQLADGMRQKGRDYEAREA